MKYKKKQQNCVLKTLHAWLDSLKKRARHVEYKHPKQQKPVECIHTSRDLKGFAQQQNGTRQTPRQTPRCAQQYAPRWWVLQHPPCTHPHTHTNEKMASHLLARQSPNNRAQHSLPTRHGHIDSALITFPAPSPPPLSTCPKKTALFFVCPLPPLACASLFSPDRLVKST